MSYFLAPSLVQLRNEVNARWPNRSKVSDGWIGDASHSARASDHNPDWRAPGRRRGVVRAIDVTTRGIDVNLLLKHTTNDRRVAYVIYNQRIFTHARGWYRYTGSNPHINHVHVSVGHTAARENQTHSWFGSASNTTTANTPIPKKDWFSMASLNDLKKAIRDELGPTGWNYKGSGENRDTYSYLRGATNAAERIEEALASLPDEIWSHQLSNSLMGTNGTTTTAQSWLTNTRRFTREYHRETAASLAAQQEIIEQLSAGEGVTIDYDKVQEAARRGAQEALEKVQDIDDQDTDE